MDFNQALDFVLQREGGLSNDPVDRGGVTNFGISQRAHPEVDVTKLTKDDAAKIYKQQYWDPIGAGTLPPEMRAVALDTAVQHGVPAAKQMIENSGGDVNKILDQRQQLYNDIVAKDPSQAKFQKGWNNRLQAVAQTTQPEQSPIDLEGAVTHMVQQGQSPITIMQTLAKAGHADEINYATNQGYSPAEIIQKFGGKPLEQFQAAKSQVDAQGFLTNLGKGVTQAGSDIASGAQQLAARATGDDVKLKQLQAQQAQLEADPIYQAQQDTAGSTIGNVGVKALPYIAATALTDGGALPVILANGAAGAASGALKPTTGSGQILPNMLTEGALGAGGAAAGALVSKGAGALAGKVLGDGQSAAEFAARKAAADAAGLPGNASSLSAPGSFWRQTAEAMPNNSSVLAAGQRADQALATKIGEGLGLKGYTGAIDHEMLQAAEPGIKAGLDEASKVSVVLPQSLKADLTNMVSGAANPLTEGIATNSTVKTAVANLLKAVDAGAPVAGKALQDLNTELKALTQAITGVSPSEKALAGKLVGKINNTLTGAMTKDQAAAYQLANNQYTHLKAVENMVKSSGDSGVVTPRQMINAVKTGRFKNAFFDGAAPYQDLANTAQDMYGPAGGKGLGSLIGGQLGHATGDLGIYAALSHPHAIPLLLAKALGSKALGAMASSENPTVARLLAGGSGGMDPTVASYITKALAGAGSATATH